ncbi:MAG: hypothetical protein HFH41_11425 [Lachnospiraceae bacterium]|nr:hypothetical protein [Lachnospiraceae bacterium]
MLKLRKPFSQKVRLHIRQDLLQSLWEKYIPSSSDKYDLIQLIYLEAAGDRQTEQPARRIQLTIQFVLKNRMVQMAMEGYPTTLFPGQRRIQDSLRRIEKYYLTQLKSSDARAFWKLNHYITLLDQTEMISRRYRHWQKENQLIEKQWKEYRLLSLFSAQVRDFLKEHSLWTVRKLEKEYIASLTETEYQGLTEGLIWQERESLLAYLKTCDEVQCRQIIERLGKEKELSQKERKDADHPLMIWKAEKENMVSCLDEISPDKVEQVWKEMEWNITEEYGVLQKKYDQKMAEIFHSQMQILLEQEPFQEIADLVDLEHLTQMVSLSGDTVQVVQTIEQQREIQREKIRRREIQALETYQEIYGEFLETRDFESSRQEHMTQVVEEMFRKRHQGERTTEEIWTLCQWSRFLLESFEASQEQAEMIHKSSREQAEMIHESSQEQAEMIHESSREQAEMIHESGQEQTEVSEEWIHLIREINGRIEEKTSKERTDREEDSYQEERVTLFWQGKDRKEQQIQEKMEELLLYIRELKEEQREERIRDLSELILFWRQVNLLQSSVLSESRQISTGESVNKRENSSEPGEIAGQEWRETAELEEIAKLEWREAVESEEIAKLEWREVAESEEIARQELKEIAESEEIIESESTEFSYRQLWEWGEALLFHPEQEGEEEKLDLLSFSDGGEQEEGQENLQTRIIRSQIEAAKNRNDLQQLVMQVNHKVSSEMIKENQEEMFQLVYADSQLGEPMIRSLLSYLRKLNETQYETLVKELSQVTKLQQVLYFGQEEAAFDGIKQMIQQKNQNFLVFVGRRREERYQMLIEKLRTLETSDQEKISVRKKGPDQKYFAAAYPMLAYEIQEYEEQQIKVRQEEIKRFQQVYFYWDTQEKNESYGLDRKRLSQTELELPQKERDPASPEIGGWERDAADLGIRSQEILQYSTQRTQVMEEEQQRIVQRVQEENIQLKTAQDQLDQKMKEVEQQLKKVEGQAKSKEDTRAFAEQVKNQLYEELHVEKLRRGLI